MKTAISIAETGLSPDFITRQGIRLLLKGRLKKQLDIDFQETVRLMSEGPLALHTASANDQHYEVPAGFFESMLGPCLKYSCSYYDSDDKTLEAAEIAMLDTTVRRAGLVDGMDILELGCGWGSLTLYMAKRFPSSNIIAISNSHNQKAFIEERARSQRLKNIQVVTSDINEYRTSGVFDRIISVEMFEHLRNYRLLFNLIAEWLKDDGRLFFHIFCHKSSPYFFSNDTEGDWMAKHFFTGGTMPSWDLPLSFNQDLTLDQRWRVNGKHYALTCRDWLRNLDRKRDSALADLHAGDNPESVKRQYHRWRIFVMACEELFAWNGGEEWFVGHYLMKRADSMAENSS